MNTGFPIFFNLIFIFPRPVILDDIYQHAEKLEDFDSLFLPTTDSYLSRHLTREMWNEYKDQSCKYGVSFKAGFASVQ